MKWETNRRGRAWSSLYVSGGTSVKDSSLVKCAENLLQKATLGSIDTERTLDKKERGRV